MDRETFNGQINEILENTPDLGGNPLSRLRDGGLERLIHDVTESEEDLSHKSKLQQARDLLKNGDVTVGVIMTTVDYEKPLNDRMILRAIDSAPGKQGISIFMSLSLTQSIESPDDRPAVAEHLKALMLNMVELHSNLVDAGKFHPANGDWKQ